MAIYFRDHDGFICGVISVSDTYNYQGFTFDYHSHLGPTKLNTDRNESARTGRKFWKAFTAWERLTNEEKEATRV